MTVHPPLLAAHVALSAVSSYVVTVLHELTDDERVQTLLRLSHLTQPERMSSRKGTVLKPTSPWGSPHPRVKAEAACRKTHMQAPRNLPAFPPMMLAAAVAEAAAAAPAVAALLATASLAAQRKTEASEALERSTSAAHWARPAGPAAPAPHPGSIGLLDLLLEGGDT